MPVFGRTKASPSKYLELLTFGTNPAELQDFSPHHFLHKLHLHHRLPPILKHKDDRIIAIDAEDDLDIPEAANNIPGPDALNGAFDHLEDTNFGDMGPEDREEEEEARVEEEEARVEEEEARVEDVVPENFDQDMPLDDIDPNGAGPDLGTMGWTDEDLDELQQLSHLEDAQDAMFFITALRKASLDDAHLWLPTDVLDRLRNPPHELPDTSDPDLILSLKLQLNDILKTTYTVTTA
ncbi:hypothetical protein EDB19DRAFT_2022332 [Suillus lakei]|nr:hypothetical protein EDB19DRAFT_2022332 [Suillus lakei]